MERQSRKVLNLHPYLPLLLLGKPEADQPFSTTVITAAINCTWNSVAGVNLSTVIYMYTNDGVTSRRPEELPPSPVKQSSAHNIPKKDAHVHCKHGMVER
jgi:hypothetical protein